MGINKAINILKRAGFNVCKNPDKTWSIHSDFDESLSDRELIKIASGFVSNSRSRVINGNVKHFRHRNNRAKTRNDIENEHYDNFDSHKLRKDENRWNWD